MTVNARPEGCVNEVAILHPVFAKSAHKNVFAAIDDFGADTAANVVANTATMPGARRRFRRGGSVARGELGAAGRQDRGQVSDTLERRLSRRSKVL